MRMGVALRQFAAARERRLAADRDVGVLGHEQRFKAALLECARQLDDVDAVIGGKVKNPDFHVLLSKKVVPRKSVRPASGGPAVGRSAQWRHSGALAWR